MKLPRQQNDGAGGQKDLGQPQRRIGGAGEKRVHFAVLGQDLGEAPPAAKHGEGDKSAHRQKGDELDDGFGRDRQHQAFLMLGGVDMAGAE